MSMDSWGTDDYKHEVAAAAEQQEYYEWVIDYFKKYEVAFKDELKMCYTPEKVTNEIDQYLYEIGEQLEDGTWELSGIWSTGDSYFIGDYKKGYLMSGEHLRAWAGYGTIPVIEQNGKRYLAIPRQDILDFAIMCTYFKILLFETRLENGELPSGVS